MASPPKKRRILNINDELPNTVFQQIFSHLSVGEKLECMEVCQYWSDMLKKSLLLHKEIIVPAGTSAVTAGARERFAEVLTLCPSLNVLDLTAVTDFDVRYLKFVSVVSSCCKQLTVLKLPGTYFTIPDAVKLAKGLTRLEQLEARRCNFTDHFLVSLFASCQDSLRILNVAHNTDITFAPFANIPVTLQNLIIDGCSKIYLTLMLEVMAHKHSLMHLSITCPHLLPFNCMSQLVQFINLQDLHISYFLPAAYLDVDDEDDDDDEGENDGIEGEGEELLDENDAIDDEGLFDLEDEIENLLEVPPFSRLQELHKLRSFGMDCRSYLNHITDENIAGIVANCPELEKLKLGRAYVQCVTPVGMRVLKDARNLRKLDVSNQHNIDDGCLEAFASLPRLHALAVMYCTSITNAGVRFLALRSTSLRELDISGNPQLGGDVSVLDQFTESGANRAEALTIYFGDTGLAKAYVSLPEHEQYAYTAGLAKLKLYPYAH